MSKANTYKSFIKTAEKIQRQIDQRIEKLQLFKYEASEIIEIHEMLERSSNIILRSEYGEYNDFVIMYNAEFLHFPNKKKNIRFLKYHPGLK